MLRLVNVMQCIMANNIKVFWVVHWIFANLFLLPCSFLDAKWFNKLKYLYFSICRYTLEFSKGEMHTVGFKFKKQWNSTCLT